MFYKEGYIVKLNENGNNWNSTGKALTIILSLSIMVLNLCVMVTTVHWENFSWIAFFINSSVLESKKFSLVSKDRKTRLKT